MFTRHLSKVLMASAMLLPTLPLFAGPVPYPNAGTIAPTVATYAESNNGVGIGLYYYGSSAGYTEGIQVYDVNTKYLSPIELVNHSSTPGQSVTVGMGSIFQGDRLVFLVDSPAGVFASEGAYSADKINHVYVTSYAGGTVNGTAIPAGLFLGFEDEPVNVSDLDYNDVEIVTNGVATTPEPSSLALFGTGVLGIAGVLKRRIA